MPIIASVLDTDLYKFTMLQVVWRQFPHVDVEYKFKCRSKDVDLRPFADEIRDEINAFCRLTPTEAELDYLKTIRFLKPAFVDSLRQMRLDPNDVQITTDKAFELHIRGHWSRTILFEVPILAIINEVYFRHTQPDAPARNGEGRERLRAKCEQIRNSDVPLRICEFGTRRRYSQSWQWTVMEELKAGIGNALVGTSNVAAAKDFDIRPFGTMAHEFLQAFQAFVALPDFQKAALEAWMQEYRGDLGIALSDVVGMDAFLRDFDLLFCKAYDGCRHDSGDPIQWGEELIAHYERMGIDPTTKTMTFSDGLDVPKAIALARHFQGRIRANFGIGTNLTNDFDFPALQIVIKMTRCKGRPVAKLSDSPGKLMSDDATFLAYLRESFQITDAA